MSSTMRKRGLTWPKRRSTSSGSAPATKLARWDDCVHVAFRIPLCCWIVTFGYIYQTRPVGIITRTNFRESVCNPLLNLSHVISAVVTRNSDTVYVVANKHAAVCFSLPNDVPRPNISQLASCNSCAALWERSQINFQTFTCGCLVRVFNLMSIEIKARRSKEVIYYINFTNILNKGNEFLIATLAGTWGVRVSYRSVYTVYSYEYKLEHFLYGRFKQSKGLTTEVEF